MKLKIWRFSVTVVVLIAVISFLGLFRYGKSEPEMFHLPYSFWVGILLTILLVIFTFIGARFFPFKDND